jgi:hypothetical protein
MFCFQKSTVSSDKLGRFPYEMTIAKHQDDARRPALHALNVIVSSPALHALNVIVSSGNRVTQSQSHRCHEQLDGVADTDASGRAHADSAVGLPLDGG